MRFRRLVVMAMLGGFDLLVALMVPLPSAWAVTLGPSDLIVVDEYGVRLLRIDPATGGQTEISSSGGLGTPSAVAVDFAGQLIVADQDAEGGHGAIIRVDPV